MLKRAIKKKIRQSVSIFLNNIFFIEINYISTYIALITTRVYCKYMSIKISYKKNLSKNKACNLVFFVDEKHNISVLKKYFSKKENSFIGDILESQNLSKKIVSFDLSSKKKIFLITVKKNVKSFEV